MGIVVTEKNRIRSLERENERLQAENRKLKADLEFVAIMTDTDGYLEEDEDNE